MGYVMWARRTNKIPSWGVIPIGLDDFPNENIPPLSSGSPSLPWMTLGEYRVCWKHQGAVIAKANSAFKDLEAWQAMAAGQTALQQGLGSVAVDSGRRTTIVAVVLWSNPGFWQFQVQGQNHLSISVYRYISLLPQFLFRYYPRLIWIPLIIIVDHN